MNKLASILAIVILWSSTAIANTPHPTFEEGSQLFVVAQSGLSLRTGAGSGEEIITIIPYGEIVQVLGSETELLEDKINWISGLWMPVHYKGQIGYVFDGYLSPLSLPTDLHELSQANMDLIYSLESWVGAHLTDTGHPDTITTDYYDQITRFYESGDYVTQMNAGNLYKLKVHFADVRLMDAYHLLKSMITDKAELNTFIESTLFLASEENELSRIKIQLENPVDIRYQKDGSVLVSISSQSYGCDLVTLEEEY